MEKLPPGERPVTEQAQPLSEISPEEIQRLERRLQKFEDLYEQHPEWEDCITREQFQKHIPHARDIPMMLSKLRDVASLRGAKVLYLDDSPQCYLRFVGYLILATHRDVELIFYHGETSEDIAANIRKRLRLYPQPHLLIVDENLELLPSFEYADHMEEGHEVIHHLQFDLQRAQIPSMGFSTDDSLADTFASVGAKFVRKNIPPEAAVEQMAGIFRLHLTGVQRQREEEERFITTD